LAALDPYFNNHVLWYSRVINRNPVTQTLCYALQLHRVQALHQSFHQAGLLDRAQVWPQASNATLRTTASLARMATSGCSGTSTKLREQRHC
jgi:hypothetical protein